MKTIQDIRREKEAKTTELIKTRSLFFAFSNEQFEQNKTPLKEGDNYVRLGAGAYMPKSEVETYLASVKQINEEFYNDINSNNLRAAHIEFELNNHEAFYTGEIDATLDALGGDYTEDEVMNVFQQLQQQVN